MNPKAIQVRVKRAMANTRQDEEKRAAQKIKDAAAKENQRKMNPKAVEERVKCAMAKTRQDEEKRAAEKVKDAAAK